MEAMEDEIKKLRGIFLKYLILKTSRIINSGIKKVNLILINTYLSIVLFVLVQLEI